MQTAHHGGFFSLRRLQKGISAFRNARSPVLRLQATVTPDAAFEAQAMNTSAGARKPVVTAIIRRDSDGKLLLVKRSDQVGSYQQYWGGVSGGVEGNESLLHRALQEISEEVGLSPQQLQLVTCGRPLPVDDGRRHFLIYPFLFNLLDRSAAITLNWENVGFDWVAASAVPHLQHVPLLPETVRRLLLPPYMANHVQYIKSDRQHGAAELAAYVLQALRAVLAYEEKSEHQIHLQTSRTAGTAAGAAAAGEQQQQQQPHEVSFEHWMEAYTTLCFLMAVARPSMAAVANAAAEMMLQLQHELEARAEPFEPTAGVARVALLDSLDKLSVAMQRQQAATISNAAAVLKGGMCVMTTSLSSTVAKALIQAHQQAISAPAAAAAAGPAAAGQGETLGSAARCIQSAPQGLAAESPQGLAQPDSGSIDVDDPNFWPSASGIGRDQPSSGSDLAALLSGYGSSSSSSFKGSSKGPGLSVIVCESRPLCEGVTMAQRLAAAGLSVTLITDAQAGVFVEEADLVLLGADAVTPAGVVNKVGSKLLALAAKAAGVPVVAVTDSLKVTPGPVAQFALPNTVLQVGEEEKDVSELLPAWGKDVAAAVVSRASAAAAAAAQHDQQHTQSTAPQAGQQHGQTLQQAGLSAAAAAAGSADTGMRASSSSSHDAGGADASSLAPGGSIELRNVYFEAVPLHLVSAVITDKGVLDKGQVAALMEARGKGYQRAFGLELPDDMLAA